MPDTTVRKGRAPAEAGAVVAAALAILFVIAAGTGLSSILPDRTPWLIAAAYLTPASFAFVAYWWMAQKS